MMFFRDFELNEICSELCVEKTLTCITKCDPTDSECISICLRAEVACVNREWSVYLISETEFITRKTSILECPCGNDCPAGCQDCGNPICECSVREHMSKGQIKAILLLKSMSKRGGSDIERL